MSWAELIDEMASLSLNTLKDKKFGKRRDSKPNPGSMDAPAPTTEETYSLESAATTEADSPMKGDIFIDNYR